MGNASFSQRMGTSQGKLIDNDFPLNARTALAYVFADLQYKSYLVAEEQIIRELHRIGRITKGDVTESDDRTLASRVANRLYKLAWHQVYFFCERVYAKLLMGVGDYDEIVCLAEVRDYFTSEVNLILEEENLAFHFVDGQFHRRGRAQTQKSLERVGTVLSDPRLEAVKNHFNKARRFFDGRPISDSENCVKEALCALEACVEVLTSKNASREFEKSIKQLQGNAPNQIPAPIGEGMIKLHGYRGSGQGVAHAATQGNRVLQIDAELVLSLVAGYVTYLADLYPLKEDFPF